jgi:hypothetical protein
MTAKPGNEHRLVCISVIERSFLTAHLYLSQAKRPGKSPWPLLDETLLKVFFSTCEEVRQYQPCCQGWAKEYDIV